MVIRPCIPISSPVTHMAHILPFLSYLAGSKSVSARLPPRPSDPDTMTNTALEAVASSSGSEFISKVAGLFGGTLRPIHSIDTAHLLQTDRQTDGHAVHVAIGDWSSPEPLSVLNVLVTNVQWSI